MTSKTLNVSEAGREFKEFLLMFTTGDLAHCRFMKAWPAEHRFISSHCIASFTTGLLQPWRQDPRQHEAFYGSSPPLQPKRPMSLFHCRRQVGRWSATRTILYLIDFVIIVTAGQLTPKLNWKEIKFWTSQWRKRCIFISWARRNNRSQTFCFIYFFQKVLRLYAITHTLSIKIEVALPFCLKLKEVSTMSDVSYLGNAMQWPQQPNEGGKNKSWGLMINTFNATFRKEILHQQN